MVTVKTCTVCFNEKKAIVEPKYYLKIWRTYRFDIDLCDKHRSELPAWLQMECIKY